MVNKEEHLEISDLLFNRAKYLYEHASNHDYVSLMLSSVGGV